MGLKKKTGRHVSMADLAMRQQGDTFPKNADGDDKPYTDETSDKAPCSIKKDKMLTSGLTLREVFDTSVVDITLEELIEETVDHLNRN